ncbi:MAG: Glu/Leu/Phe/Val dehydrogenase dimerization domain-containing protein, partial [Phycisphaerales bacterium]
MSTTTADGFAKYQAFYQRPPAIVVEWHDDVTDAVGWLCIDSLRGGAAGGGTRMRDKGTREEAVFLAKTMAVKFRACGPDIGGGKSVIRFNAATPTDVKHGVLERWYRHIGPYLKNCYGTGGDVGVDEVSEATAVTQRVLGLGHVQEGIARGHQW